MTATSDAPNEHQQCHDTPPKISAMLIMGEEQSGPLVAALQADGVEVLTAGSCQEAKRLLEGEPALQVLLTDRTLRDQDWVGTLKVMTQIPEHVQLVICCRRSDHRQAIAALELGAYDVLLEPYEPGEIVSIVRGAAARSDRYARRSAQVEDYHSTWLPSLEAEGTATVKAARESLRWSELY